MSSVHAHQHWLLYALVAVPLVFVGCDTTSNGTGIDSEFNLNNCTIPTQNIARGCSGPDCIPALSDPDLTTSRTEEAAYLADTSRVIGLLFGDQALAIPHNILWFHEIVNFDDWAGRTFAVTYCPLTGSSLAFDRSAVDGAELRVSGLLFNNNLIMYDRQEETSLWPQMNRAANCGANVGEELSMLPIVEMRWGQWKALHPRTKVLSRRTGHVNRYTERSYPYGDYERKNNDRLLYDMGRLNEERPPKERVLGIPSGRGGLALPFGELSTQAAQAVSVSVGGEDLVVFWDRGGRAAMAYRPVHDGETFSFQVANNRIVDEQTGSTWTVEGRAIDGEMQGTQLEPVTDAYVSFWFAWASFQPETRLWTSAG